MGANTAALPLYWRESAGGASTTDMLDERLAQGAPGCASSSCGLPLGKTLAPSMRPTISSKTPRPTGWPKMPAASPRSAFAPPVRRPGKATTPPASGDGPLGRIRRRAHRDPFPSGERTGHLGAATAAIATPATRNTSPAAGLSAMATRQRSVQRRLGDGIHRPAGPAGCTVYPLPPLYQRVDGGGCGPYARESIPPAAQ